MELASTVMGAMVFVPHVHIEVVCDTYKSRERERESMYM